VVISGIITTNLGKTAGLQGAKDGYITPKAYLSSSLRRGFFLALAMHPRVCRENSKKYRKSNQL
jgi:hypothetical protein